AKLTSGKAGGELQAINVTIPGYIANMNSLAVQLRDTVNNLHGAITGEIATGAQDLSSLPSLSFNVNFNGGGWVNVGVAPADYSGATGAADLQQAIQDGLDTTLGAGNATATVTGGNGSPLEISIAPTAGSSLLVQAIPGDAGLTTLLGTTAVGTDGIGGRQFFSGTDANTLALSSDVAGNPNAVAAGIASGGGLDTSRALDLADLGSATTGPDAYYRQLIVQLGVDSQTAQRRADIQQQSTTNLDNSRSAQSSVNLDEEMTNMVEFQHAYEAAARFLTAIDQMLDTLVNHTGVVG
ncbi:MAG TPA: flagellar basal body rod C-terminal domain-containing protein, partial [Acidimicrobiia bacterium]|nr:flagellar basal body rod C-terminal domain-containing protein [Acidimicrobiia bacterium]